MKSPRTRWPRPSRVLGLLAVAGVLGGWIMVTRPVPTKPGLPAPGRGPAAKAGGPSIRIWTVSPEPSEPVDRPVPPGPIDRCLIPAPDVDARFAFPAPDVDDRMVVRPLVTGMPVNSR